MAPERAAGWAEQSFSNGDLTVSIQDHADETPVMGRRTLRMSTAFLPVLMGKGIRHYSVHKDALPEDCRIVDATVCFRSAVGGAELVLLLESEEWGAVEGLPPEIKPSLIKHHC